MLGPKVIVIGGGLSGLSAAHAVLQQGGRVLLLDKMAFLGGNSTRATSGINGATTRSQIKLKIPDTVESFLADTALSAAAGRNDPPTPLAKVLVGNSASAVEWLQERFGLDLSLVSRLGGHSHPRTHRGKERFPGMTITYALMEKLEEIEQKEPTRAKVITKARATKLLRNSAGSVIGVEYEKDGKTSQEFGAVVISTGGFAADYTSGGLLARLRPDLLSVPTTNGEHCTGDGIKMALAIGAGTADIAQVQVHPTGLVHPDEPNAQLKFLAAEALRGVGGIILNGKGERFCNDLGRRDYVSGEMKKTTPPWRLVLNSAAAKEIEWHVKHYQGRGLMKQFATGADLAREMKIPVEKLKDTFDKYNSYAKNKNDPWGKLYFHNVPFDVNDSFYVGLVVPVVHYCMGGIRISAEAEVVTPQNKVIPGLFASGEVAGGVHGINRLGGSSLLDCVVFGRVAGESAARYLFDYSLSQMGDFSAQAAHKRLGGIARQISGGAGRVQITINVDGDEGVSTSSSSTTSSSSSSAPPVVPIHCDDVSVSDLKAGAGVDAYSVPPLADGAVGYDPDEVKAPGSSAPAAPKPAPAPAPASAPAPRAAAPAAGGDGKKRSYTLEEVNKHKTDKDCWVIVNGEVLDVTSFLKDHPGGKQAIMLYAGKDATAEFNMLHKPDVVKKHAPHCIIGTYSGPPSKGH